MVVATGNRRANHWIGSAKLGSDDGRNGGTAVVDLNTKVYGTDNLFVVDASIFPGMVSTNPSALIVTASEHASEKILALPVTTAVGKYGQCNGQTYSGSMVCANGLTCTYKDAYYSQVSDPFPFTFHSLHCLIVFSIGLERLMLTVSIVPLKSLFLLVLCIQVLILHQTGSVMVI